MGGGGVKNRPKKRYVIVERLYVNDLHNSSKLFQFSLFADDTTVLTKKGINNNLISRELCRISLWLRVNKLSLYVGLLKSKCIYFHQPQKKIELEIIIDW